MTAGAHLTSPCRNCPYRLDAPRGHWHRSEFVGVLANDRSELGAIYACHHQIDLPPRERGFCAGWLLDQKRRSLPSITLRIHLSDDPAALTALEAVSAKGIALFPSVEAMCRANGVRPPKARR